MRTDELSREAIVFAAFLPRLIRRAIHCDGILRYWILIAGFFNTIRAKVVSPALCVIASSHLTAGSAPENHRSGIPDGLGLDERQEISVDRFGFRSGHTVREAFVGFQRAILQQFGAQWRRVGIGYDLIIVAVHDQCRDRDLL
jgi:hypothetical protein